MSGVARNVQWRQNRVPILTFRVEEVDEVGNVTGYTSVEARPDEIADVVTDGDEVEVTGIVTEDDVLEIVELRNLTTGVTFDPRSHSLVRWGGLAFMGALFGAGLGAAVGSFVAPFSSVPAAVGALLGTIGLVAAVRLHQRSKYDIDDGTDALTTPETAASVPSDEDTDGNRGGPTDAGVESE